MIKQPVMYNSNKTDNEPQPIWRKTSPAIPVRENLRTSYLQLSGMHGDHLPRLRRVERPEFSQKVRHYESICQSSLMKNVNVMYREHKHMMRKLARGQDTAYKVMCKVQREKRRVQRAECARKQEEFREKMKSHRMRALLLNVVAKFRENVRIKKRKRALTQQKKTDDNLTQQKKTDDSLTQQKKTDDNLTQQKKTDDNLTQQKKTDDSLNVNRSDNTLSVHHQIPATQSKIQNSSREPDSDEVLNPPKRDNDGLYGGRKGSLTRDKESIKPLVTTAENRNRWDSDLNNNLTELPDVAKKSRVLEVSKSVAQPVTKTKRNNTELGDRENTNVTMQSRSASNINSVISGDGVDIDTESHLAEEKGDNITEMNTENQGTRRHTSARRTSIFEDDQQPDYGWFTIGNPVVNGIPPSSTNVWSRKNTIAESMDEELESDHQTLPPVRRRKAGLARPPSAYLREQMDSFQHQYSHIQSPGKTSVCEDSRYSDFNSDLSRNGTEYMDIGGSGTSRSLPVVHSLQGISSESNSQLSPTLSSSFYPVSNPLQSIQRSNITSFKTLSSSTSKLLPVNPTLRTKRPQHAKDKHMSANMLWVLKQEQKSKKQWEKLMPEEEKILKYYKTKDGEFRTMAVEKRKTFTPPSNKEKHRQRKLLIGEKVLDSDRRERIDEFYKTIPHGEPPLDFYYEVAAASEPLKKQQKDKPIASKFGDMYDAFKDKDMINPVNPDSYDAMKAVAYLRVRDDGNGGIKNLTSDTDD